MIPLLFFRKLPAAVTVCTLMFILPGAVLKAQTASFTAPDTVCLGSPVTITNTSTGGSTYYWSFCTGNTLQNPLGTNIGNPGNLLNVPSYPTLVKDGNTCYSFITNEGGGFLVRNNHGTSFSNNPVSSVNLGSLGLITDSVLGIKICQDGGVWLGFILNNNRILKLNFGASLGNVPTATILGTYSAMLEGHCIDIINDGGTWVGYITSWGNHKLLRLNFGASLSNVPVMTDLGSPGALNNPGVFRIIKENGIWYALVSNMTNHTMTRLTFGASLLTAPTGVNLGVICPTVSPGGLTLIRDCENTVGFHLNYSLSSPDKIWRLSFPTGITGTIIPASLGNIGGMTQPAQFSELVREGDTLFVYNTNRQGTLTRLYFPPCTNASVPSSALFTPPVFSYNQPGTYNIQLTVNEGLPSQSSICKSIVVKTCSAVAAFTAPDTVCTGAPVTLTNLSTGGSTNYWNFCSGSAAGDPAGTNIGNPGSNISLPVYSTSVQDGTDCYSFVTNHGTPTHMTRIYYGNNFRNAPVNSASILQTGVISATCEDIQIRKENGNWYGFLNNNTTILRLNFGASITNNSPTTTDIGPFPNISVAHGLVILQEGNTWLGFFDSDTQNKLYRLNFGTSLTNIPVFTDLGNLAGFVHPCQIASIRENGICYLLLVNSVGNTLSRINFGTSYLNTPTGENLGNCGILVNPVGLTLLNDCEISVGYYTVYQSPATAAIGRLTFTGGVGGTVTAQSLGNIGTLDHPCSFSEMFRENDSLFSYVTNQNSSSLTRLSFPPCNNASIPSSTLFNPPQFSYNTPGNYAVRLVVDEGQASEQSICQTIVAMAPQVVNLGNDKSICPGNSTILDAGANFSSYLWSTGATSRTITVAVPGSYSVTATRWGCSTSDAVNVNLLSGPVVNLGPDVTICSGMTNTFDAGPCAGCAFQWADLTTAQMNIGNGQTYATGVAGNYMVTVVGPNSCMGRDTAQLFVQSTIPVSVSISAPATTVCAGSQVTFTAMALFGGSSPGYQWKVNGVITGATGQTFTYTPANGDCVVCVVTSTASCTTGNPATSNPVCMTVTPNVTAGVTVTASSNPVCAGMAVTYFANPVYGGPTPSYQWKVNASNVSNAINANYAYIPVNGDVVTCEMTSSEMCTIGNPATSLPVVMTVNPNLPVSVSAASSATTVCAGTTVTFWATPVHGGTTPAYQWKINAGNASNATNATNASYAYIPVQGDVITCEMTSSESCTQGNPATSLPITMTVNPNLPVTVNISASSNPYCAGSSVAFTATPGFGGLTPGYQWKINANNASNGNNASYAYNAVNGDVVTCELTSSESCTSGNPATSNTITMVATPVLPAGITITATPNPFCPGTAVTFDAFPIYGGPAPGYQWKINASNAGNANNASYTYNPVAGDLVSCELTSNQACITNNPAISTAILMATRPVPNVSFYRCFDSITTTVSKPFHLRGGLPPGGTYSGAGVNPATGIFNPATAGPGTHTISYTCTNTYGCIANATTTVTTQTAIPVICGNTFTDPRDNRHYSTFSLPNGKCWMKENLDFGTAIMESTLQTDNCVAEKYRRYSATNNQYSSFYQWDELMQYDNTAALQGLCPPGWHIPTATEWNELILFSTGPGQAGGPLKDTLLTNGFHSFQRGLLYLNHTWAFVTGKYAGSMYWTSTVFDTERATARGINEFNFSVSLYNALRENAFSVRCTHD
ncbi:MAG: FISUMP domain-containing protein [Bacteroidota bacterium]